MKLKPGYRTSEFWFTLVTFIFSGLYLTGIIHDNDQKEELINNVSHAVESVILIGGQGLILYRYLTSRQKEKLEHEKTQQKQSENHSKELEEYVGMNKQLNLIDINHANVGELVQLPHIGIALAQRIIEHRQVIGKYTHPEQLLEVAVINDSKYTDIKNYIKLEETDNDPARKPKARTTKTRRRKPKSSGDS